MGRLHGPVVGGVVQIDQRVKFRKEVQSGLWYPWQNVWHVDGEDGSDDYSGRGPSDAKATIQAAVTAASRGDIIYVRPKKMESDYSDIGKYAEVVTVPLATYNLSMIGIQNSKSPNYGVKMRQNTALSYCLDVYAPGFNLENFCLQKGGTGEGGLRLRGADAPAYNAEAGSCGATIYNVTFRYAKLLIEGGYASIIDACTFENIDEYAFDLSSSVNPARRHKLLNSYFLANNGTAVSKTNIRVVSTTTDFVIDHCWFDIIPGNSRYMVADAGLKGMMANCVFLSADVSMGATAKHITVPTSFRVVNCFDESGTMIART